MGFTVAITNPQISGVTHRPLLITGDFGPTLHHSTPLKGDPVTGQLFFVSSFLPKRPFTACLLTPSKIERDRIPTDPVKRKLRSSRFCCGLRSWAVGPTVDEKWILESH